MSLLLGSWLVAVVAFFVLQEKAIWLGGVIFMLMGAMVFVMAPQERGRHHKQTLWVGIGTLVIGLAMLVTSIVVLLSRPDTTAAGEVSAPVTLTTNPATPTEIPAATETPTQTPPTTTPTPTTLPSPTPELLSPDCLPNAAFVADVTIPDGTQFSPGETFTKTWRVRSTGCAGWPAGTQLMFVSGDQLGGPEVVAVPESEPSVEVELSVKLTAPTEPGTYTSNWQLRGPDATFFGDWIYVVIVVP